MRIPQATVFARRVVAAATVVAGLACGSGQEDAEPILVRLMADTTSDLSFVGESYHAGRVDRLTAINEEGGIHGRVIAFEESETGLDFTEEYRAFLAWKRNSDWPSTITVFGGGSRGAESLVGEATEAQMPFFPQALAPSIGNPTSRDETITLPDGTPLAIDTPGAPYHFPVGPDDTSVLRLGLEFMASIGGRVLTFGHCTTLAECSGSVEVGKALARGRYGMTVLDDLVIETDESPSEVTTKVQAYLAASPTAEWIWLGHGHATAANVIAAAAGADVRFMAGLSTMDEQLYIDAGRPEAGRLFGAVATTPFGALADVPAMQDLVTTYQRYREQEVDDGTHTTPRNLANVHYVRGYATVVVWEIAVGRILVRGDELTRTAVRDELDALTNVNTGGLLPPVTYTATDHRPAQQIDIYTFEDDGTFQYRNTQRLERSPETLGW